MPTIRDVARAAGVSSAAVSRVLNADPTISISAEKRQAILQAAAAIGYRTPRNRRRQTTGKLALVNFLDPAEELGDPYFVSLRLGMESRCQELGRELIRLQGDQLSAQAAVLQTAAGVIVAGHDGSEDLSSLDGFGGHLVYTDCQPSENGDSVGADLRGAMMDLLNRLDRAGYQRIAYIGKAEAASGQGDLRWLTYGEWMRDRGRFDPSLCALATEPLHRQWEQLGHTMTGRLLAGPVVPDVIVAFNDNVAVGVYRALHEHRIDVPQQMAVAGFNDIPAARFLTPPLSTVRLPAEAIGVAAVDLLTERLQGRDVAKQVILSTTLVWRGSTRQPG